MNWTGLGRGVTPKALEISNLCCISSRFFLSWPPNLLRIQVVVERATEPQSETSKKRLPRKQLFRKIFGTDSGVHGTSSGQAIVIKLVESLPKRSTTYPASYAWDGLGGPSYRSPNKVPPRKVLHGEAQIQESKALTLAKLDASNSWNPSPGCLSTNLESCMWFRLGDWNTDFYMRFRLKSASVVA